MRFEQSPLHGLFVLDSEQQIVMESVSTVAVSDIEALLAKIEPTLDLLRKVPIDE